ncbi:MAG: aromatic-ring-hydroxylating dioxygenase subunit beta [Acidimicrobiia bacterium]
MTQQPLDRSSVDSALVDFIFLEARLADEARYTEWESLWHERDALYWVPMHEGADPETEVSYIYDNKPRISKRVAQLKTGARHSQTPPSRMRRIISNFELVAADDVSATVAANFVLFEYRFSLITWAGRYVYRIRTDGDRLALAGKTVHLVNGDGAVPTMSFLI